MIPLVRTVRSTGQAVALEAMSMRKPLVILDSPGILDYLEDNRNGLLYREGDAASLSEKLHRVLADVELRCRLADGAAASINDKCNKESYATLLTEAIGWRPWQGSLSKEAIHTLTGSSGQSFPPRSRSQSS